MNKFIVNKKKIIIIIRHPHLTPSAGLGASQSSSTPIVGYIYDGAIRMLYSHKLNLATAIGCSITVV